MFRLLLTYEDNSVGLTRPPMDRWLIERLLDEVSYAGEYEGRRVIRAIIVHDYEYA